jgi:3-oxoacyl-[acyl-carrier protein] reductase
MHSLKARVAIVTGSGRGIGRAIALKLAKEGAAVVVNDIDAEPAAEVVRAIEALGGRASACVGDVTAAEFADRFVGTAVREYGGLDIVVNNAGYTWDSVIQKMTDEQFRAMLDVHLNAPFRVLRAAAPVFRETAKREAEDGIVRHRKVVNVTSIMGLFGNAGQANYASAKAGLVGLTKALAKEWGRYRVNVNAVAFGVIETRLTQVVETGPAKIAIGDREVPVGVPPSMIETTNKLIPLGRSGTVEEAAGGVYLMCAPESDYVTGQVLLVAGGLTL